MNINTKSWHYRLIRRLGLRVPNNLCAYFWKVVLSLSSVLLMGVGVALVCFAAFMALIYFPFIDYNPVSNSIGALCWIGAGFIALQTARAINRDVHPDSWLFYPLVTVELPITSNSILVAYLASIHDKVCPTLEFREGGDK